MKKLTLFALIISVFIAAFVIINLKQNTGSLPIAAQMQHFADKEASKYFPNDNFYFQRTYPDFEFDFEAYRSVLQKTKQQDDFSLLQKENEGFSAPWKLEGPNNIGGRINVVVGDSRNQDIIYVGCAKGGVFKTIDGGQKWTPIFDDQLFLSIGAISIDPSNSDIIYVGTGDLNISGHFAVGDGVYKSVDGGETWTHLGLTEQRIVSKILINPIDPQIVYVSCMGNPLERNSDRGVYRSKDGGETWEQVLFVAEDAGVIDMVMNPQIPDIIYAAGWNRIRTTQESVTRGDDAKIFRSTDGGDSWEVLTEGLPNEDMSRIGLEISPSDPNVLMSVYVSTSHELEGIYKSTDSGNTWVEIPTFEGQGLPNSPLGGFGWYFGKIGISPKSDDNIFLLGVNMYETKDAGATWQLSDDFSVHADKHSIFFIDENIILLATDGGLYKSIDGGASWIDIENIPNTQYYRVTNNPHNDEYWGGTQDNGTIHGNTSTINQWQRSYGGDGFQVQFAPDNPNVIWAETQWGGMVVSNNGGGNFFGGTSGIDNNDRVNWDMPFIMSSHNSDVLYSGTYRLYKNETGTNEFWNPISEDLTDGIVFGANFHTITCIEESPVYDDLLYVGTSDANVWRSFDGGETWDNITHDLPERYVTSIVASKHNSNILYVTHSGFKGNGFIPHIHRSMDYGETWEDISSDLPPIGVNNFLTLPEDLDDNYLFAATDAGIYASIDAGQGWNRLGSNMPYVFVFDMDYDQINRKLIAGTFARSMYSFPLDSIIDYGVLTDIEDVGLQNNEMNLLQISPNPATDFVNITLQENQTSSKPASKYEWRIYTLEGQEVLKEEGSSPNIKIEIQELPSGTYFLQANYNNIQTTKRFIKK